MTNKKYNYKVAIMMCCYNGENYLAEAIESVLSQSYKNWELFFWDNRSNDNSAEIFKSYKDKRLKYFLSPNHTDLGGSRFAAWKVIDGDLVAILDTDDVWEKDKLEHQVEHFEDKTVGISITNTYFFNSNKSKLAFSKPPPSGNVYYELIKKYFISLETVVIKKSFVESLETAFDPKYNYICDMDLLIRLSRICNLSYDHKPLSRWRYHNKSLTFKEPINFITEKKIFLKNLDIVNHLEDTRYIKARNKYLENLIISDFINKLLINKKIKYFKLISDYKFFNLKILIIFLVSILPFGKKFLLYVRNRIGMII